MTKCILLLEDSKTGAPVAVVCNSVDAADKLRAVTPMEVLGTIPIVSRVDAVLGVTA